MSQETLSKPAWMDKFGARLLQLEPSMNAVAAAGHAVEAHASSFGIEPEAAAEAYAASLDSEGLRERLSRRTRGNS